MAARITRTLSGLLKLMASRSARTLRKRVCRTGMASYIAHHTKKKRILARKDADLQRLINSHTPADKLVAAAEVVRDARIRVLKVRRAFIVTGSDAASQYAKIDAKIKRVAETTATAILSEFGYST